MNETIDELLAQSAQSPSAARRAKQKQELAALVGQPYDSPDQQNATAAAAGADVGEVIRRQIEEAKKRRLTQPGQKTTSVVTPGQSPYLQNQDDIYVA